MLNSISAYNLTSTIQNNMFLNRGLIDIGGIAIPNAVMANNQVEAKERFSKSLIFTILSLGFPIVAAPFINKTVLQALGFKNLSLKSANKLMEIPYKNLGDNNSDLNKLVQIYHSDNTTLTKNLLKAKSAALGLNIFATGLLLGIIPWAVNKVSKNITQQEGFSAEFEMGSKEQIENNSAKWKRNRKKNFCTFIGTSLLGATATSLALYKAISKKNPSGILKQLKLNSDKFDFNKGFIMKLLPFFLIELFCVIPGHLLASRSDNELKDSAIRLGVMDTLFFGGDFALNKIGAVLSDKFLKTKILKNDKDINQTSLLNGLKKPVRTLEEIENLNIGAKEKIKTKKVALGMYWTNLLIIMGSIGFAMPYILNKYLIKKNMNNQNETQTI
ncbi:MAG: hypothetical protein MJ237_08430 [bacterium]|nr:hypothetical protein [bacterium]